MNQQKPIELIIYRHILSYISTPAILLDAQRDLIYFNKPVEKLFGVRFSEAGLISSSGWSTLIIPLDPDNHPMSPEFSPIIQCFNTKLSAYGAIYIMSKNNKIWKTEIFVHPIINQIDQFLGAVAYMKESVE
jgi:hypothetical protein